MSTTATTSASRIVPLLPLLLLLPLLPLLPPRPLLPPSPLLQALFLLLPQLLTLPLLLPLPIPQHQLPLTITLITTSTIYFPVLDHPPHTHTYQRSQLQI
jgi:hypothetical protein